jgi:hypothetical protein
LEGAVAGTMAKGRNVLMEEESANLDLPLGTRNKGK